MSLFFVEHLLPRSTEKLHRATVLCFREVLVSRNWLDKRGRGRGCHDSESYKNFAP